MPFSLIAEVIVRRTDWVTLTSKDSPTTTRKLDAKEGVRVYTRCIPSAFSGIPHHHSASTFSDSRQTPGAILVGMCMCTSPDGRSAMAFFCL